MADVRGSVRLLVAGLHPLLLEDIRLLAEPSYDIVAIGADEDVLLPAVDRLKPAIVFIDLLHTGSVQTIRRVTAVNPTTRVVAVTGMRRRDVTESVLAAGAIGVIPRSHAAAELNAAAKMVISGNHYLSPWLSEQVPVGRTDPRRQPPEGPSALDKVILRLSVKGYPDSRIARVLGLSVGTVRLSLASLKRYCRLHSSRDLKNFAATHNLAS